MAHIKWLGVQGTLTEAITSGSVVIESDGLVDLPAISDPDIAYIVIDPNGTAGRPELVIVTGHEDLATPDTFATVLRGQHTGHGGSVARSHAAGTPWYHAASPQDFKQIASDTAQRESLVVGDGDMVWQTDTNEHWTYIDGATPFWQKNNTYHQFVYDSSETSPTGNLYNDWQEMISAMSQEAGPKIIVFKQDETIPAGAWNLDDVQLRGNGLEYTAGGFTVTFGDNTTISSWTNPSVYSLRLLSTSTTGPIWSPTTAVSLLLETLTHVHSTTQPFIQHSGTGQFVISLKGSARFKLLSGGVHNFHSEADAFSQVVIYRGDNSLVDNNTLSSTNALVFIDIIADVANDLTVGSYPSTHTALNVGFSMGLMLTAALALGFNPTGLSVITATNAQDAIEELDAAVSGLQNSPTVVADETARTVLVSSDGELVWQTDANELYVYVDAATPSWERVYPAGDTQLSIDNPDLWGTNLGYDEEFNDFSSSLPNGWAWKNQSTSTFSQSFGKGVVAAPAAAGIHWRGIVRPVPAVSSYELVTKMSWTSRSGNESATGIGFTDSGTKLLSFYWYSLNGSNVMYLVSWTDLDGAGSSIKAGPIIPSPTVMPNYFRVRKNSATSYDFAYSSDGVMWYTVISGYDVSAVLTPTGVGFLAYNSAGYAWNQGLEWFRVRNIGWTPTP